jgi:hypothetical protein
MVQINFPFERGLAERWQLAQQIAATGAIMTVPGVPLIRHLVGELRWGDEGRVFWYVAFGDKLGDGYVASYDDITLHPVGVCFEYRGEIVALLAPIEKCAVEDPNDYRVAWNLWREVRPLRGNLIDAAFDGCMSAPHRASAGVSHRGSGVLAASL